YSFGVKSSESERRRNGRLDSSDHHFCGGTSHREDRVFGERQQRDAAKRRVLCMPQADGFAGGSRAEPEHAVGPWCGAVSLHIRVQRNSPSSPVLLALRASSIRRRKRGAQMVIRGGPSKLLHATCEDARA